MTMVDNQQSASEMSDLSIRPADSLQLIPSPAGEGGKPKACLSDSSARPIFFILRKDSPMKKSLFLLMLTASLGAYAANHEVKMLDNGKDGSMVFEPGYVNAKVGDTVTFKAANKGHWVQSKALPDGVADFLSEDGKDFTLKLDKEGVYVYTCPPHRMMNMSGVIQVGKPVNKAKAQAVVDELENRAMQSKGRLKKYMQQVK